MSSVIEVIVDSDIIYEVTLDQPASIYEVTISHTSPTYDVIEFDPGMLSLALIDDSTATAFRAYSSFKVSQLLTGYALGTHNHTGVYEPIDPTILRDADIGVTLQAYDADLTSWAGITPSSKQDTLVSGTNIKSINGTTILGAGDITISGGGSINYGLINTQINQLGGSF